MNLMHRRHGLTLLEITLAMVVLTVLAMVVVKYVQQPADRVKREACNLRIQQLQVLTRQYETDFGRLPHRDLRELSDARYLGEEIPRCPVDQRRFVIDPRDGLVLPHNHP